MSNPCQKGGKRSEICMLEKQYFYDGLPIRDKTLYNHIEQCRFELLGAFSSKMCKLSYTLNIIGVRVRIFYITQRELMETL